MIIHHSFHRQARSQKFSLLRIVLVLLFPVLFVSGAPLPFSVCVTLSSLAANYFMFYNTETFFGLIIMAVTHHEKLKAALAQSKLQRHKRQSPKSPFFSVLYHVCPSSVVVHV